jgi:4'-phosphopantetheinyl transferase EntD
MTLAVARIVEAALAALLPPGVTVAVTGVDGGDEHELLAGEADAARSMVPRRRREFAAGRACARKALASLGLPAVALPVAPDRSATWPPGVCGSITHAGAWAAAAAARQELLAGIGIDLEDCAPLEADLVARLCRPEELVNAPPGLPAGIWPRMVFSAKESVYKCVRARVGRFIDFDEVGVGATADRTSGSGDPTGRLSFAPAGPATDLAIVGRLAGRYAVAGGLIVTAAWLAPARGGHE